MCVELALVNTPELTSRVIALNVLLFDVISGAMSEQTLLILEDSVAQIADHFVHSMSLHMCVEKTPRLPCLSTSGMSAQVFAGQ